MIFRYIVMFFHGILWISIEGFFIERFINQCKNNNILLQDIHIENNYYMKVKILKSDFKAVKQIAKKAKCKVKIEKKIGLPFILNRYRKRKIFAIAILVIAIFIFVMTRFIWNIEVVGNERIEKEEIINLVERYGISVGKLKRNMDLD